MKKVLLISSALLVCSSIFALSYKNNTYQKLADEYSKKVQDAIDAGEYELSIEYSKLVEENSALSKAYVQKMIAKDEASEAMKSARTKIDLVKKMKSSKVDIDTLAAAENSYGYAKIEFDKDTEDGYKAAKNYSNQISERFSKLENFLNNSILFEKIDLARDCAIKEGADKYYPKQLSSFDAQNSLLRDDFNKDENVDYSKNLTDLLKKYQSLEKASIASSLKDCLISYDSKNNNAFADKINKCDLEINKYSKIDVSASGDEFYSQSEKAFDCCNEVVNNDFVEIVLNERRLTLEAKELAEFEKAQVNSNTKDAYKKTADVVRMADSDFLDKNNKDALNGYRASKNSYIQQYELAKDKRVNAQNYLESVEKLISNVLLDAERADKISPLTEKIEDIEDNNKKSILDYKFANPKDFIIDLKEIKKITSDDENKEVLESVESEKSEEVETENLEQVNVENVENEKSNTALLNEPETESTKVVEVEEDKIESVVDEADIPVEVVEDGETE